MILLRLPSGKVINMDQIVAFGVLKDAGHAAEMRLLLHAPDGEYVTNVITVLNEDAIALDATLREQSTAELSAEALATVQDWQEERDRLRAKLSAQVAQDQEVRDDSAF